MLGLPTRGVERRHACNEHSVRATLAVPSHCKTSKDDFSILPKGIKTVPSLDDIHNLSFGM